MDRTDAQKLQAHAEREALVTALWVERGTTIAHARVLVMEGVRPKE